MLLTVKQIFHPDISTKKDGIVIKEFAKRISCKVIVLSSYDDLKIIQEVMKLEWLFDKQCAETILLKPYTLLLTAKNIL
jgi:hypothetical protein